uniref:Predicted protein n=1 Tax=Hordeum vulgare subsp. vulgare TaxID=112509 RepID=F2DF35_HORVV|nr:predicted protein [Hordeum vulgare subsp. vulgare]
MVEGSKLLEGVVPWVVLGIHMHTKDFLVLLIYLLYTAGIQEKRNSVNVKRVILAAATAHGDGCLRY